MCVLLHILDLNISLALFGHNCESDASVRRVAGSGSRASVESERNGRVHDAAHHENARRRRSIGMAPCETRLWQVLDSAGAYTVRRKVGWECSRMHRVRIPIFLHLAQQLIVCVHPSFSRCKVVSPSRLFIVISHDLLSANSSRLGTCVIRCSLRVDSEDEDQCERNSLQGSHHRSPQSRKKQVDFLGERAWFSSVVLTVHLEIKFAAILQREKERGREGEGKRKERGKSSLLSSPQTQLQMNPALRARVPPGRCGGAKVACEQDEHMIRTASVSSSTPLVFDDGHGETSASLDDETDAKVQAAAFTAHEHLRREGKAANKFGKTVWVRFWKILLAHPNNVDGTLVFMPDRDPYERLAGIWAAMSVYGSLVGVAALQYGMPDTNAEERNLFYHISSALLLSASMLLIVPVCQLTVLTIMFGMIPSRQLRAKLLGNPVLVAVTGPIHLIATQLVFLGIVFRLISVLDFDRLIMLMYLVPFLLAFGSMWAFTIYTVAVTMDYGLHADAWKEALEKTGLLPSIRGDAGAPNRPAGTPDSPQQRQMMPNDQ